MKGRNGVGLEMIEVGAVLIVAELRMITIRKKEIRIIQRPARYDPKGPDPGITRRRHHQCDEQDEQDVDGAR